MLHDNNDIIRVAATFQGLEGEKSGTLSKLLNSLTPAQVGQYVETAKKGNINATKLIPTKEIIVVEKANGKEPVKVKTFNLPTKEMTPVDEGGTKLIPKNRAVDGVIPARQTLVKETPVTTNKKLPDITRLDNPREMIPIDEGGVYTPDNNTPEIPTDRETTGFDKPEIVVIDRATNTYTSAGQSGIMTIPMIDTGGVVYVEPVESVTEPGSDATNNLLFPILAGLALYYLTQN